MKKTLNILTLFVFSIPLFAQVNSTVFENNDAFENYTILKATLSKPIQTKNMPPFNIEKLLLEDKQNESMLDVPFRFGYGFDVNYTLEDGTWEKQMTEQVWSLKISSHGAYSLNFIFDDLHLSPNARLYIFNSNGTMVYGPVTSEQNLNDGIFLTDLIIGDEVIIQLFEPYDSKENSTFRISNVVHAYKNMFSSVSRENTLMAASYSCHNNVTCYPDWTKESDAVAVILLSNGTSICTGALLNNTAQNYKPFVLTAFHCVDNEVNSNGCPNRILSSQEITAAKNWAFRFNYKKTTCNGSTVTSYITYNQANFRAAWANTDFALMELVSNITTDKISFAGWDRSGNTPTSGTGIHHPGGEPMKISFDNQSLTTKTTIIDWNNYCYTTPANTHWVVGFDNGTTEGGSSGSPLFDQNKKIIGQLHGGSSGCAPITKYYGQFHKSWTGGGTNDTRLSNWLDPTGSGVLTLNTIKYPSISGSSQMCVGSSATYTVSNAPAGFTWSCSSNLTKTSSSGNTATFTAHSKSSCWVGIRVGNVDIVRKNILIGTPAGTISGPYDLSCNCLVYPTHPGNYKVKAMSLSESVSSNYIEWRVIPPTAEFIWLYVGENPVVSFHEVGDYTVQMRWKGTCGYSQYTTKTIRIPENSFYSYSAAYPNPAGNELIIDREETDNETQQANNATVKVLLYSHSTTKLAYSKDFPASAQQIKIDTSQLPDGIYYLNIISNNEKIKEQTIIVKH